MKKLIIIPAALIMVLGIAGCAQDTTDVTPQPIEASQPEESQPEPTPTPTETQTLLEPLESDTNTNQERPAAKSDEPPLIKYSGSGVLEDAKLTVRKGQYFYLPIPDGKAETLPNIQADETFAKQGFFKKVPDWGGDFPLTAVEGKGDSAGVVWQALDKAGTTVIKSTFIKDGKEQTWKLTLTVK